MESYKEVKTKWVMLRKERKFFEADQLKHKLNTWKK